MLYCVGQDRLIAGGDQIEWIFFSIATAHESLQGRYVLIKMNQIRQLADLLKSDRKPLMSNMIMFRIHKTPVSDIQLPLIIKFSTALNYDRGKFHESYK